MIANANSIRIPLANKSVHMCVTSPPYYGLRDYGLPGTDWGAVTYTPMAGLPSLTVKPWNGCLGLEPTPEMFVAHIVAMFREVWRVLRDGGTLWLNFGDSYAGSGKGGQSEEKRSENWQPVYGNKGMNYGLKPKDLIGIPWRVAFALQADGWYLRNDIIWNKTNCMPESVRDRCTKSHEYLFLLAKSARYFYDAEAVKEDSEWDGKSGTKNYRSGIGRINAGMNSGGASTSRNRRTVWTISTKPYKGAHFATYPTDLVRPCILAGTSQHGVCPVCGSPWERVTEREAAPSVENSGLDRYGDQSAGVHRKVGGQYQKWLDAHPKQTTGWRPTCEHEADPIPAKVLDPFCGSGTTGEVCRETGRKFVGLDLSQRYLVDFALHRAEGK